MKLSRLTALTGAGALLAATVFTFQACSSDEESSGSVGGPPARPDAPATTSTTVKTFAIKELLLGDAPRGGAQSTSAWKKYGYNIDGKVSTKSSTDTCKLPSGASKAVQEDGDTGIDNSFGANILPIILNTAGAEGPAKINEAIGKGDFTIQLTVKGLTDDAKQTNTGLTGYLNPAGQFDENGGAPTFTTSDDWPVRPELLSSPSDPTSSKIRFDEAYIVNGTFVSGNKSEVQISLVFSGVALDLTVHSAVMTFDHTAPNKADNGTVAGVLDTNELIEGLRKVAGRISTSLCSGSAFDGIAQQIRQASDILADGTQDSGKECNGISVGLGFNALEVGNPTKVAPLGDPTDDPCEGGGGDAGSDAGGDAGGDASSDATTD